MKEKLLIAIIAIYAVCMTACSSGQQESAMSDVEQNVSDDVNTSLPEDQIVQDESEEEKDVCIDGDAVYDSNTEQDYESEEDVGDASTIPTGQLSDGVYGALFTADDFIEEYGNVYLIFDYYTYTTHEQSELLTLSEGDTVMYDGKAIYINDISIETWDNDGIQMYSVYINLSDDFYDQAGFVTDINNPNMLKEVQLGGGDAYPLYKHAGCETLQLDNNAILYVQEQPDEGFLEFDTNDMVAYCENTGFDGFPECCDITVKNNMITKIEKNWIP